MILHPFHHTLLRGFQPSRPSTLSYISFNLHHQIQIQLQISSPSSLLESLLLFVLLCWTSFVLLYMGLLDASSSSFIFILLVPSVFFALLVLVLLHVCLHYMEASYMGLKHNLEMHPWCCVCGIYGNHEKLVVGGGAKNLIVHYKFCDYWCPPCPCENSTSWLYPSISSKHTNIVKTKKKQKNSQIFLWIFHVLTMSFHLLQT